MERKVIGAGGGGKGGGGASRAPVEDPDSLRSKQYARVLDLISEGEIEGFAGGHESFLRNVFFDGTPVQNEDGTLNFSGVTIDYRKGTSIQAPIAGFDAVESEIAVGIELKYDNPYEITVTDPNVDAVRVTIEIPQLSKQDVNTGDLKGSAVAVQCMTNTDGGGWRPYIIGTKWSAAGVPLAPMFTLTSGVLTTTVPAMGMIVEVVQEEMGTTIDFAPEGGIVTYSSGEAVARLEWKKTTDSVWTQGASFKVRKYPASGLPGYNTSGTGAVRVSTGTLPEGQYDVRVVKISGPGTVKFPAVTGHQILYGSPEDVIKGKTMSRYRRSYYIKLPAGNTRMIRFSRTSADSTSSAVQNKTYVSSYTLITEVKLSYPNCATVGVSIDAAQFNSIPTRGYKIRGIRVQVPSNYNPETRTYTGTWDGTFKIAWTNNPAWIFFDLATQPRYGLGKYVRQAEVDKWKLYAIGQYCDETVPDGFGDTEPRFVCNAYVQDRQEARNLLQNLASVFRGLSYWAASLLMVTHDAPTSATKLFTPANVIGGEFTYSGSSRAARHTVALITWNDPKDQYKQKVEYVADEDGIARYGVVEVQASSFGCTSQGQAHRYGRAILFAETMETDTVTFGTALEGSNCYPGAVIKVADPTRSVNRMGGRLIAATLTQVTVDAPVARGNGTSHSLSVVLPDGRVETRMLQSWTGTTTVLTVTTPFSDVPAYGAMWIYAHSAMEPTLWRVLSVSMRGSTEVTITASTYNPDKYAAIEANLVIEPRTTTVSTILAAPTELTVVENIFLPNPFTVTNRATFSWLAPAGAVRFSVKITKPDGTTKMDVTEMPSYDLDNTEAGDHVFEVTAINALGRMGVAARTTVTLEANLAQQPPQDVTGFTYEVQVSGVRLKWDAVPDIDVQDYVIKVGANWDSGSEIFTGKATDYVWAMLQSGTYNLMIRARDLLGNLSTNAATMSVVITSPGPVSITQEVIDNNVMLRWSESLSMLPLDFYMVHRGDNYATAELVGTVYGRFAALIEQVGGAKKFWVTAVDLGGNLGTPASVTAVVNQPPDFVLRNEFQSSLGGTRTNVLLEQGKLYAPLNTSETFAQHFTTRGWTTPQSQISAGYPGYWQPGNTTASTYVETFDCGVLISSGTTIRATPTSNVISGSVTTTCLIQTSTDGTTWDAGTADFSRFTSNFRYVRVTLTFTPDGGGNDLIEVSGLNVKVSIKQITDAGVRTAASGGQILAADAASGGTVVTFNKQFIDIESIIVTPLNASAARIPIVNFADVPNPTSFKVILYNTSGVAQTGDITWTARGA